MSVFSLAGGREWSLYIYEIANEGQINIQLVSPEKRDISTKQYIEKLHSKVNKLLIPNAKIMVVPMKVKGIKKIGESDIEVKIKGQDLKTLFKLAGAMRRRCFRNAWTR